MIRFNSCNFQLENAVIYYISILQDIVLFILHCLKLNTVFWDGYNILQELLHYDKYETYSDAERFLDRTISKLIASNDELLFKVASSYKKLKVGIINGLARNQTGKRFSNAIAENNHSHIQKLSMSLMVKKF